MGETWEYQEDPEDLEASPWSSAMSLSEVLEHCVIPTAESGTAHVGKVIAWCIIFRLTTQTGSIYGHFLQLEL